MNIIEFCKENKVSIKNKWIAENPNMGGMPRNWLSTLKMGRRQMTVPFSQGIAHKAEPTADDVLDCLVSDAHGYENSRDFTDWANEYGYDPDSRRAEKIYNAVKIQSAKLEKFAGNKHGELMECEGI